MRNMSMILEIDALVLCSFAITSMRESVLHIEEAKKGSLPKPGAS